jgi:hypothetical protein
MSKNLPRLEGGLIARKGEAVPTAQARTEPLAAAPAGEIQEPPAHANQTTAIVPKGLAGTIAVTVRLDPARYERLKIHGAKKRQSNQQILVAALDAYL